MSMIKFRSAAGKGKAFCPGCGKPVKIIERVEVSTSTDHFTYETEGITVTCAHCKTHEIQRRVMVD